MEPKSLGKSLFYKEHPHPPQVGLGMDTDLENQGGKVKPRIVAGTYEERKGKCRQNPEGTQAWVSCSSGMRDLGA